MLKNATGSDSTDSTEPSHMERERQCSESVRPMTESMRYERSPQWILLPTIAAFCMIVQFGAVL